MQVSRRIRVCWGGLCVSGRRIRVCWGGLCVSGRRITACISRRLYFTPCRLSLLSIYGPEKKKAFGPPCGRLYFTPCRLSLLRNKGDPNLGAPSPQPPPPQLKERNKDDLNLGAALCVLRGRGGRWQGLQAATRVRDLIRARVLVLANATPAAPPPSAPCSPWRHPCQPRLPLARWSATPVSHILAPSV